MTEESTHRRSKVAVRVNDDGLWQALDLLAVVISRYPHVAKVVIHSFLSADDFIQAHRHNVAASGTGDVWIDLQPSDRFREFLSAATTVNGDGKGIE